MARGGWDKPGHEVRREVIESPTYPDGPGTRGTFAARGAFVGVHYNTSKEQAQRTLDGITARGGRGALLRADLSIPSEAESLVGEFVEKAGGRLDALDHPVEPDGGDGHARIAANEGVGDVQRQHIAANDVAVFVGGRELAHRIPAANVGPGLPTRWSPSNLGRVKSVNPVCQDTPACVPSYPRQCARLLPQCANRIGTLGGT